MYQFDTYHELAQIIVWCREKGWEPGIYPRLILGPGRDTSGSLDRRQLALLVQGNRPMFGNGADHSD